MRKWLVVTYLPSSTDPLVHQTAIQERDPGSIVQTMERPVDLRIVWRKTTSIRARLSRAVQADLIEEAGPIDGEGAWLYRLLRPRLAVASAVCTESFVGVYMPQ